MEQDIITLIDLFRWMNVRIIAVSYLAMAIRLHDRTCRRREAHDRTRAALIAAVKRYPGMLVCRIESDRLRLIELVRRPDKYKRFTRTQLYYDTMHSPHQKRTLAELETCVFDFSFLGGRNGDTHPRVATARAGVQKRSRRHANAAALGKAGITKSA